MTNSTEMAIIGRRECMSEAVHDRKVDTHKFGGLTSASDGIVNVAVGGHIRPMRERDFLVHGGFATSRSPVGDADQVFNHVNLASWTFGVSGARAKFQSAAGFNLRFGTTDDIVVRNLLSGDPFHTKVDVRTAGFIYSIAYQF